MKRQSLPAIVFGASLVIALSLIQLADPFAVRTLRETALDQLQRLKPRADTPLPVRIVDIDEPSLARLGQWPWPRNRLAEIVNNLSTLGAAAIAFDFAFAEPDRMSPKSLLAGETTTGLRLASELPDFDAAFAQAASQAPVIFAFAVRRGEEKQRPEPKSGFVQAGTSALALTPQFRSATPILAPLQESAAGIGSMSLSPDATSGAIRRVPLLWSDGDRLYPGLALEALRVALGEQTYIVHSSNDSPGAVQSVSVGEFNIPTNASGEIWMHYRREAFQDYVPAHALVDTIDTAALAPLIEGHIILVGTSAAGLLDMRTTALGENVPGVSIHAQLLEQILSDSYLLRDDWVRGLEIAATLLVGLAIAVLVAVYGPLPSLIIGGLIAAFVASASWFLFSEMRMLVDPSFTLASGLLVHFAITSFRYLITDRQARFIRRAFSQYVAPGVLANIERNPQSLGLGGEIRPLTIMFVDIRNFTTLSEALEPEELVTFLNKLLSALSSCVVDELGTIDKYIGDSVMAFWNAPIDVPDHALRACHAALAMRRRLDQLNEQDAFGFRKANRTHARVEIGIGINSGPACVGNMGSQTRFNYSAVGDAVNLAARVESACKEVGFDIIISQQTAIDAGQLALLDAGTIRMKGKAQPQAIQLVLGDMTLRNSSVFGELNAAHERFMSALQAHQRHDISRYGLRCRGIARQLGLDLGTFYDALETRRALNAAQNPEDIIAASKQVMISS